MYISQITLRDWKAYTTASFDFPRPSPGKNIVLIGAPNGYGKTSLFEAIVLGMFGRDGLPLIGRSPFSGGDKDRLATSYKSFLEKALHRGAIVAGRNSCSVKLVFVDDDEEPLMMRSRSKSSAFGISTMLVFTVRKTKKYIFLRGPCLSGCYPHPLNVGCAHSPE